MDLAPCLLGIDAWEPRWRESCANDGVGEVEAQEGDEEEERGAEVLEERLVKRGQASSQASA